MKAQHLVLICLATIFSCKQAEKKNPEWTFLFDGDNLEQWDTYLGPRFGPDVSWEDIGSQPAIGQNNDSLGVFSIVDMEGVDTAGTGSLADSVIRDHGPVICLTGCQVLNVECGVIETREYPGLLHHGRNICFCL